MADSNQQTQPADAQRCPQCDSVFADNATRCLMCGYELDAAGVPPAETDSEAEAALAATPMPTVVPANSPLRRLKLNRQMGYWAITAVVVTVTLVLGVLIVRYQPDELVLAWLPTGTAVAPIETPSPTWTPLPTQTSRPTATPTITPTPEPTSTLQPPRLHIVTAGETLIGLAGFYRVSVESIVAENNLSGPNAIQTNQQLMVPWPTPTPPLEPVAQEINGELVIADPADCERYTAGEGDSLSAIAVRFDVDFNLFLAVNRLTTDYVLQPGDSLCIPRIVYGASLPPTPGPSPTPTLTPPPRGPALLFPVEGATVQPPDGIVMLQWAVVKTLADDEYYMVELLDMDDPNPIPLRGFTRATSFQVPSEWRPDVPTVRQMRWRVAIVQVTDVRSDGLPIYRYGGETSEPAFFFWEGAVPTPTPTMTPTPSATPTAVE